MKRFFVVAAVMGMLAALGSQAWAQSHCCWEGNSYNDNKGYCGPVTPGGSATTEGTAAYCEAQYGTLVNGCSSCDVGSGSKDDGQKCDGYCKWGSACEAISTDPTGQYGTATTTCEAAIKNCDDNGNGRYAAAGCSGDPIGGPAAEACGYFCQWDDACWEIKTDPKGTNGPITTSCEDAIANCDKDGARYTDGPNGAAKCSGTQIGGEETCGGYCKWESGCEAIKTDKTGQYGPVVSTCSEAIENCDRDGTRYTDASCNTPAVGVKFIANAAKTPGLKVSYAKNRVSVNWTPASKIAKGTVQLINAKGVALSTAFIKDNSSKVSVKLGTVGVPAGMYFIHINAVGQNGKRIVTQSAISIVK